MNLGELNCTPCSCINSVSRLHIFSQFNAKQCFPIFAGNSARGNRNRIYPGRVHLKLANGRPPPVRQARKLLPLKPCWVKSDDAAEELMSGESILLNEQALKQDLEIAIEEENYAEAAKIRDSLRALHDDSKASVLAANARFYKSFRNGDLAAMQALWTKGDNACCVHPGANGITGYEFVMESWEIVWVNYEFPLEIELKDVEVHVRGNVGYVTCTEFVKTKGGSWGAQFATNVFERIHGEWFMCVHHASPVDFGNVAFAFRT